VKDVYGIIQIKSPETEASLGNLMGYFDGSQAWPIPLNSAFSDCDHAI
jgi:hypothetical protein